MRKKVPLIFLSLVILIIIVFVIPAIITQVNNNKWSNENIGSNGCPNDTVVIIRGEDTGNLVAINDYLQSQKITYPFDLDYGSDRAGIVFNFGHRKLDDQSDIKSFQSKLQEQLKNSPINQLINRIDIEQLNIVCPKLL